MPPVVCDPLVESSGNIYRYFTLPIEQIPNFEADKTQVLCRSANGGLCWSTAECIPVVTCVSINNSSDSSSDDCQCEISLSRRNVYVLKDAGATSEPCSTSEIISYQYVYDNVSHQWVSMIPPSG